MDEIRRCYGVLGLEHGASAEDVKEAWRDLVQVWHPDRFSSNERLQRKAQEALKSINRAYETLRDRKPWRPAGAEDAPQPPYDYTVYPRDEQFEAEIRVSPIEILKESVPTWNLWRKKYSDLQPDFTAANLSRLDLSGADLREVNLTRANLQDANLYKANLSAASLIGARLQRADLGRAILQRTRLASSDLSGVDLSGADLSGADLAHCRLGGANLIATNLSGADLRDAVGLTKQQMAYTSVNSQTRLPRYL